MHGFSERIKNLREQMGFTQSQLAKKLYLTRASVNSWEMGLSAPSTSTIVELSRLFHVSTDYLLGLDENAYIRTDGLSEKEVGALLNTIDCFYSLRKNSCSDEE